jgi:hypothetical protein
MSRMRAPLQVPVSLEALNKDSFSRRSSARLKRVTVVRSFVASPVGPQATA